MLYINDNESQNFDFSNMNFEEIMKKLNELIQLNKEEKNNVTFKNDKKILNYEKLKIGLINISTLNDNIINREIKKKDYILEIFDNDKELNIFICTENNISDFKEASIKKLSNYSTIKKLKRGGITFYFRNGM